MLHIKKKKPFKYKKVKNNDFSYYEDVRFYIESSKFILPHSHVNLKHNQTV